MVYLEVQEGTREALIGKRMTNILGLLRLFFGDWVWDKGLLVPLRPLQEAEQGGVRAGRKDRGELSSPMTHGVHTWPPDDSALLLPDCQGAKDGLSAACSTKHPNQSRIWEVS